MAFEIDSPHLVPFDGRFHLEDAPTSPGKRGPDKAECVARLGEAVVGISELQRRLYAQDIYAVLLIFQGMDAAGKDGTIRACLTGVNPTGCQVHSFKRPSTEEIDHDFLWRTASRLPERGRIGIFNRSYYEEVLVVRTHPEVLSKQRLPPTDDRETFWKNRFESIRDHEKHLARNGTVILKFWLHVSKAEQQERLLARLDDTDNLWKFELGDLDERKLWPEYMEAADDMVNATSRPWAPWYVIPADDKHYMRMAVSETLHATLSALAPSWPDADAELVARYDEARRQLES